MSKYNKKYQEISTFTPILSNGIVIMVDRKSIKINNKVAKINKYILDYNDDINIYL